MWEYEVMTIIPSDNITPDVTKTLLNKRGEKGWELVSVVGTVFYFKRKCITVGAVQMNTHAATPYLGSIE